MAVNVLNVAHLCYWKIKFKML